MSDDYHAHIFQIAKMAFDGCWDGLKSKRRSMLTASVKLREWNHLIVYTAQIKDLVPDNIVDAPHFSLVEACGNELFEHVTARLALQQMAEISSSVIDICDSFNLEFFPGMSLSRAAPMVQFVMCMCFICCSYNADDFDLLS